MADILVNAKSDGQLCFLAFFQVDDKQLTLMPSDFVLSDPQSSLTCNMLFSDCLLPPPMPTRSVFAPINTNLSLIKTKFGNGHLHPHLDSGLLLHTESRQTYLYTIYHEWWLYQRNKTKTKNREMVGEM